jgi:hypothetical protein
LISGGDGHVLSGLVWYVTPCIHLAKSQNKQTNKQTNNNKIHVGGKFMLSFNIYRVFESFIYLILNKEY